MFPTHSLNCKKKKKKIILQTAQRQNAEMSCYSRPNLSVIFFKTMSFSSCRATMSESVRSVHCHVSVKKLGLGLKNHVLRCGYIYKSFQFTSFYFPALSKLSSQHVLQPGQSTSNEVLFCVFESGAAFSVWKAVSPPFHRWILQHSEFCLYIQGVFIARLLHRAIWRRVTKWLLLSGVRDPATKAVLWMTRSQSGRDRQH